MDFAALGRRHALRLTPVCSGARTLFRVVRAYLCHRPHGRLAVAAGERAQAPAPTALVRSSSGRKSARGRWLTARHSASPGGSKWSSSAIAARQLQPASAAGSDAGRGTCRPVRHATAGAPGAYVHIRASSCTLTGMDPQSLPALQGGMPAAVAV
eukprot:366406-Chlamydomonas_euryale.AAC.30